jgi:hypothetical protein
VRTLAAIAVALILVPAAGAAKPPLPLRPATFHIVRLAPPAKHMASCSVHSKAKTKLGRASRKVLPVACEQPPRVNLTGISGSIQALFGP